MILLWQRGLKSFFKIYHEGRIEAEKQLFIACVGNGNHPFPTAAEEIPFTQTI